MSVSKRYFKYARLMEKNERKFIEAFDKKRLSTDKKVERFFERGNPRASLFQIACSWKKWLAAKHMLPYVDEIEPRDLILVYRNKEFGDMVMEKYLKQHGGKLPKEIEKKGESRHVRDEMPTLVYFIHNGCNLNLFKKLIELGEDVNQDYEVEKGERTGQIILGSLLSQRWEYGVWKPDIALWLYNNKREELKLSRHQVWTIFHIWGKYFQPVFECIYESESAQRLFWILCEIADDGSIFRSLYFHALKELKRKKEEFDENEVEIKEKIELVLKMARYAIARGAKPAYDNVPDELKEFVASCLSQQDCCECKGSGKRTRFDANLTKENLAKMRREVESLKSLNEKEK